MNPDGFCIIRLLIARTAGDGPLRIRRFKYE